MTIKKDEVWVKNLLTVLTVILLLLLLSASWETKDNAALTRPNFTSAGTAKNLIFVIGDGMGLSQISVLNFSKQNQTNFEYFPVVGFQKTHSADNLVTDSAASATAMSCGVKTQNTIIGMDADSIPVRTVFEEGKDRGFKIGIAVSAALTHATPASFYAHQSSRGMTEHIATDLANSEFDFLVGGGKKDFVYRYYDNRNLVTEMEAKGYTVTNSKPRKKVLETESKIIWFTAAEQPPKASEGRNYMPTATETTLNFLNKKDDRFLALIEGSQIDWGGHAKDEEMIISEMKDFDDILEKVLAFAQKDKETLVVVTADHECGGAAINGSKKLKYTSKGFGTLNMSFTTKGHTATMVPVFAYGPGSELFAGIYDNTEIYHKIRQAMGWKEELRIEN